MFRHRLIPSCLALGLSAAGASCAREVEIDPNPTSAAVAQFDPTNPIGVLQLVPSPTALAQNPDGTLNQAQLAPEACELPTAAQCLQFVSGWPVTTPITLFFSEAVEPQSVLAGVSLWEAQESGAFVEIDLAFANPNDPITARPPINAACRTQYAIEDGDIPPGVQAVLVPTQPIKPHTRYFVKVESTANGGVRDLEGNRVEPSALFSLLNVDDKDAPVQTDGTISSALLRSQVVSTILASADFDGDGVPDNKPLADLDAESRAKFDAALASSGLRLRGLYEFFSGISNGFLAQGLLDNRDDAIFLNFWTSGGETQLEFDPAAQKFPFPNLPLMTRTSTDGIMVFLPPDPRDSPTAAALKRGLNTLDGFSNTAPIAITFTGEVDETTLADNVIVRIVDDQGLASGMPIPMVLTYTSSSAFGPATLTIRPFMPLLQDQMYVVAVTDGLRDTNGFPISSSSTFKILRDVDEPFNGDTIPTLAEQGFQCSTVPTTGMLASDSEVVGLANRLEIEANHPRWTESVRALEMTAANPIPRENLVMAFLYKTQSITTTVDQVKNLLLANVWEPLDGRPRVVGPVLDIVGSSSIAELIGVVPNFCVGFCEVGAMEPRIDRNDCANPAVATDLVCQLAHTVIVGNLARASLYLMKGYRATVGSPFAGGTFTAETVTRPEVIDIPVWVVLPGTPPPAEGYPVAIFQHGLGQMKENGFLIANTLANTGDGWATVMIDFPFHGGRASDLVNNATGVPCSTGGVPDVDPALVQCNPANGMCQGGCDGLQDRSATGLLSPNLFGVRDNFRQGTIDQLTLLRTLQQEARAAGLLPQLNGARVGYIGQSLGGIAGGNFAAYVRPDELQGVVINVGGGSLTNVILNTVPDISAPLYAALAAAGVCEFNVEGNPASGCRPTQAFRQFLLIAQWVLDPGDPHGTSVGVLYERDLLTPGGPVPIPPLDPAKVLMQMSRPDPVVPNSSSLLLGLAYGFNLNLATTPFTSMDDHFQIYDFSMLPQATMGSGCHGFLLAPTCGRVDDNGDPDVADVLCNTAGAQQQAAGFIDSGGTIVPPRRPGQVSGIPCPAEE